MTFTPVIPQGGYGGWAFLTQTLSAQKRAFSADPTLQRDEAYFRDKIGSVSTAAQLVGDRRLLSVALKAFGLGADINNKYFIQKVLGDGTQSSAALANKLADKRYLQFSQAFGFGDGAVPNTKSAGFADTILGAYEDQGFQMAVGTQNDDMRLALNAQTQLASIAGQSSTDNTKWFTVMGSPPLRTVVQTALGLPQGFSNLDLDTQLSVLKSSSARQIGGTDFSQFSDPVNVGKLIRLFVVRSQAQSSTMSPNSAALTLLQGGAGGGALQATGATGGSLLSLYV